MNRPHFIWWLLLPHTGPSIQFDQHISREHQRRGISRIAAHRIPIEGASHPVLLSVNLDSGRTMTIEGFQRPAVIREMLDEFMGKGRG